MSSNLHFTDADHALMVAILKQVEVGKIDNERLRVDLGLNTKSAASVRLSRLRAKLGKEGVRQTGPPTTPKAKSSPNKGKAGGENTSKKRKLSMSDDEDDEEEEIDLVVPTLEEKEEGEEKVAIIVTETPTRKLPQRKARVMTFKQESDHDFDSGEDLSEDFPAEEADAGSEISEAALVGGLTDDEM